MTDTPHAGRSIETNYGFGWSTGEGKFGHGGAYKTNMTIDPQTGLITIFLIHHSNDWPSMRMAKTALPSLHRSGGKVVAEERLNFGEETLYKAPSA